ncbi:unnamed protein product, partial [marine sediment metagenome]
MELLTQAEQRIKELIEKTDNHIVEMRLEEVSLHTSGYKEDGYDEVALIALGNWNSVGSRADPEEEEDRTLCDLGDWLVKLGAEIEWNDEWRTCDDCAGLVRTSPNGYGWEPGYVRLGEGHDCYCHACVKASHTGEYLSSLEAEHTKAVSGAMGIDLAEHGYVKLNEEAFEAGLHAGQDA